MNNIKFNYLTEILILPVRYIFSILNECSADKPVQYKFRIFRDSSVISNDVKRKFTQERAPPCRTVRPQVTNRRTFNRRQQIKQMLHNFNNNIK